MVDEQVAVYWQAFLASLSPDSSFHKRPWVAESWGDNPTLADELGGLIASGKKTATCSSLWEWQARGEPIPEVGYLTVVLDGNQHPLCIVETVEINLCNYDQVDASFAYDEGEGDRSLPYWREAHWRYFSRVLAKINRQPAQDMPLVCERFKVIYK